MRKVKITGYVIYDDLEEIYGDSRIDGETIAGIIEDRLFQEDFPREWSFEVESDEEVDWKEEDE